MSRHAEDRHLDASTALDYLEQRLDASARRAVEGHLSRPCSACRERLRQLGAIITTMRDDRAPEVPERLTQRALEVFTLGERPSAIRAGLEAIARLVFDSFASPLPVAARRSVGEARRLRYALGESTMEVEVEREGRSTMTLRGRLDATDAPLWTISVLASGEASELTPDAFGHFSIDGLPIGALELRARGPAGEFTAMGIEP